MKVLPACAGTGIIFVRTDLEGKPEITAHVDKVLNTPRCTILGDEKVFVQTVEHLLAAFSAYGIDNVRIELDGPEVPILDGSSLGFVELIEEAGLKELDEIKNVHTIASPIYWNQGDAFIVAIPSDEFKITYTLSYPGHPLLEAQTYTLVLSPESFKKQIAPCRTFVLFEEVAPLIDKGLIKGASLDSGVVIKGKEVLNSEGLRFSNEMVRHKILDLIGDLSLAGAPFNAHIIAMRSGHAANAEFARELCHYFAGGE